MQGQQHQRTLVGLADADLAAGAEAAVQFEAIDAVEPVEGGFAVRARFVITDKPALTEEQVETIKEAA